MAKKRPSNDSFPKKQKHHKDHFLSNEKALVRQLSHHGGLSSRPQTRHNTKADRTAPHIPYLTSLTSSPKVLPYLSYFSLDCPSETPSSIFPSNSCHAKSLSLQHPPAFPLTSCLMTKACLSSTLHKIPSHPVSFSFSPPAYVLSSFQAPFPPISDHAFTFLSPKFAMLPASLPPCLAPSSNIKTNSFPPLLFPFYRTLPLLNATQDPFPPRLILVFPSSIRLVFIPSTLSFPSFKAISVLI